MASDNRIERTIGLVMLAVLAIGCVLVLRPFFTAVCFALILVVATWPAFERLQHLLGGRKTLAALLMVTLATLVFVMPPVLVASSMDYNVAGSVRLLQDLSERGVPPPPPWVAEIDVIGPEIHNRWQVLARGGPEAAERIQRSMAWGRQQLIDAGLSLGNAILQLILAMFTAFFLYRDGAAVRLGLIAAGRRIAGDNAPRLLRVAQATINGVVYGVLGTALAQALLTLIGLWAAGIPAALLLGLLLFVLALIPFGPLLIWGPAAVWLYIGGESGWAIFVVIWSLAAGGRHRQPAEAVPDQSRQRHAPDPDPVRRDRRGSRVRRARAVPWPDPARGRLRAAPGVERRREARRAARPHRLIL